MGSGVKREVLEISLGIVTGLVDMTGRQVPSLIMVITWVFMHACDRFLMDLEGDSVIFTALN